MNALRKTYQDKILKQLQKEFKIDNIMATPKLTKIVVNIGVSEPQHQKKAIDNIAEQFKVITGQKPLVTTARVSIAGFKLRAGDPIGLKVTLRGERMYQFMQRLCSVVLPRVKDFQGVPKDAFDQSGNYSLGIKEQIVFPEIDYDKIDKVRSLQATFVSSTQDTTQSKRLLELLGMPFEKEEQR